MVHVETFDRFIFDIQQTPSLAFLYCYTHIQHSKFSLCIYILKIETVVPPTLSLSRIGWTSVGGSG